LQEHKINLIGDLNLDIQAAESIPQLGLQTLDGG
jgi:hypothetical protein